MQAGTVYRVAARAERRSCLFGTGGKLFLFAAVLSRPAPMSPRVSRYRYTSLYTSFKIIYLEHLQRTYTEKASHLFWMRAVQSLAAPTRNEKHKSLTKNPSKSLKARRISGLLSAVKRYRCRIPEVAYCLERAPLGKSHLRRWNMPYFWYGGRPGDSFLGGSARTGPAGSWVTSLGS